MRFQKLMISTVISLWMDADRTIGRWGAFEVNISSLVTYRESCCHISLMLIDFLQLCSNIMELDCNGAQLQTKVLPSFRVCSVWDLQPPPLLSNYTWPYLESFHCYNELWFENVTINHNLRISFYFLTSDLAVVCLALELHTRSICQLVVVGESRHARPELSLLRQSPHRTACTRDRAGW